MEQCFHKVDVCDARQKQEQRCLSQSQSCFDYNKQGFEYCFRQLSKCIHLDDDEHEDGHDEVEDDHIHETCTCSCSCHLNKCFDEGDKTSCSIMFDACFESGQLEERDGIGIIGIYLILFLNDHIWF